MIRKPFARDILVEMEFGSIVYGTSTPESDRDIKGVFVPLGEDILMQRAPRNVSFSTKENARAKNTKNDVDEEYFSIAEYMRLLSDGHTVVVDMLFVPSGHILHTSKRYDWFWESLQKHAADFIPQSTKAFTGYCRTQANKYGIKGSRVSAMREVVYALEQLPQKTRLSAHISLLKAAFEGKPHIEFPTRPGGGNSLVTYIDVCGKLAPETMVVESANDIYKKMLVQYGERARQAEMNEGVDWKAVAHAIRVMYEAHELFKTGRITFPRPEREHLLEIRRGLLAYRDIANELDTGIDALEAFGMSNSGVLKGPAKDVSDRLVLSLHSDAVRGGKTSPRIGAWLKEVVGHGRV